MNSMSNSSDNFFFFLHATKDYSLRVESVLGVWEQVWSPEDYPRFLLIVLSGAIESIPLVQGHVTTPPPSENVISRHDQTVLTLYFGHSTGMPNLSTNLTPLVAYSKTYVSPKNVQTVSKGRVYRCPSACATIPLIGTFIVWKIVILHRWRQRSPGGRWDAIVTEQGLHQKLFRPYIYIYISLPTTK